MVWKSGPGIFLWKEQKKTWKKAAGAGGRNAGGQEKGRISHEPEMHWNRYRRHDRKARYV